MTHISLNMHILSLNAKEYIYLPQHISKEREKMPSYKPRRPAQLKPDQIDLIDGGIDIAAAYELAHTTAHALVHLPSAKSSDQAITARIMQLIANEGIDSIAETWVDSPAESLPGTLWRGYLLREWIRRFPSDAETRYKLAVNYSGKNQSSEDRALADTISTPANMRTLWDGVLAGKLSSCTHTATTSAVCTEEFAHILRESARFTDFIAQVTPEWIGDDRHPLATTVTRRNTALVRTAMEFKEARELLLGSRLD